MPALDVNQESLQALIACLQRTLSSNIEERKPAEAFLESNEKNENYGMLLLTLIDKQDADPVIRVTAAVTFKNYVRRNWVEDQNITDADRNKIRSLILGLMLKSPDQVQRQLSDAVSIIGKIDFPDRWPNLMDEMVQHIQHSGGDFVIINGVLQTAHSLFKRYRHEFKSDKLWIEIKLVLTKFAAPFTELFVTLVNLSKTHSDNAVALKVIFSSLVLCAKIFNSLNSQDLPEYFEDNMATWMPSFLELLSYKNNLLESDDEEEAGVLEQLKSQICDNCSLYAQKYHEEFESYMPHFVEAIWKLLVETGIEPKYDLLVSTAINFLTTVAERPQYSKLFAESNVLDSICSKVIIPNMAFRTSDEEMFQDNPEEYIRRDIEGSDVDTRRRAACDLVRILSRHFEQQITAVFSKYIETMLSEFAQNPQQNWKSKDAALYLVTSMAAKSTTTRFGLTSTSQLVNVVDFYEKFVKSDLEAQDLTLFPVLRADALKYVVTFRNQLPLQTHLLPSFPLIINHLAAPSVVVHTFAAHAIERLLLMRNPQDLRNTILKANDIEGLAPVMLKGLFAVFKLEGSAENEYAMRAIVRTITLLQEKIIPFIPEYFPFLMEKLALVIRNPTKPIFNHYLFESISLTISISCQQSKQSAASFEAALFPCFQTILQQDIQEFAPYVFQILALLLEAHDEGIPDFYLQLLPFLILPAVWERPANIGSLVRLLESYLEKGAKQAIDSNQRLEAFLGIFQKLIASKINDHEGIKLLLAIMKRVDQNMVKPYVNSIFNILFKRLTSSKTQKYACGLLVFFSAFAHLYGAPTLAETVESLQPNLFLMVIERLYLLEAEGITDKNQRIICCVGITDILCTLPQMFEAKLLGLWPRLLETLIKLYETSGTETEQEEELEVETTFGQGEDQTVYGTQGSVLVSATKKQVDFFDGQIPNPKLYTAQNLSQLSAKYPGKIGPLIQTGMTPQSASFLQSYLAAANITIV